MLWWKHVMCKTYYSQKEYLIMSALFYFFNYSNWYFELHNAVSLEIIHSTLFANFILQMLHLKRKIHLPYTFSSAIRAFNISENSKQLR